MSLFTEILLKEFPKMVPPTLSRSSVSILNNLTGEYPVYDNSVKLVYSIFFLHLEYTFKNKFDILHTIVLNNDDLSLDEKEYIFSCFTKAMNKYSHLRRLCFKLRHKYIKIYENEYDMCYNLLSTFNNNQLVLLIENNIGYKFRLSDLINIINKSLSHSVYFIGEPQFIKNPYTNIPFSLHNLFNIYYRIQNSNYKLPILFVCYFNCNFNISEFKDRYECLIRDHYIKNFVESESVDVVCDYIYKMLYKYRKFVHFIIDSRFPKNKLVKTFRTYLQMFILSEYSLDPQVRYKNQISLEYNLLLFSHFNPNFGKKIRKRRYSIDDLMEFVFNDTAVDMSNVAVYISRPLNTNNEVNNDSDEDNSSEENYREDNDDNPNANYFLN